ncbi:MAG: protein phosphatase 2C domain-containing protein [Xanthomonadaceae bacterium]|nr:protein phosphatase 2C domain-containing protein [Xanthomonadaceae bacterium]
MNDKSGARGSLTWRSTSCSDVGAVRKVNEDSMLDRPERGLWAVADGMGGHSAGDRASQLVVARLDALTMPDDLVAAINLVDDVLVRTNTELRELAETEHKRTIGCTAAAMIARGKHFACLWAGDSRVYRHRPGGDFSQLTQDHAMVEHMVTQGILSREEAENHPQANLITRAVGASDVLFVDVELFEAQVGDILMICSDGLYKEVEFDEIGAILADDSVDDKAQALVDLALGRRARDNTTVVVVHIEEAAQ